MTKSEAIKRLKDILGECTESEEAVCYVTNVDAPVLEMAINALKERIERKPDECVPELLDDEIKLPKISRLEAKAIKVALYHQWIRVTDDNGIAISCSQEMAGATYRMLFLFDKLIKESDKDNEIKEKL